MVLFRDRTVAKIERSDILAVQIKKKDLLIKEARVRILEWELKVYQKIEDFFLYVRTSDWLRLHTCLSFWDLYYKTLI